MIESERFEPHEPSTLWLVPVQLFRPRQLEFTWSIMVCIKHRARLHRDLDGVTFPVKCYGPDSDLFVKAELRDSITRFLHQSLRTTSDYSHTTSLHCFVRIVSGAQISQSSCQLGNRGTSPSQGSKFRELQGQCIASRARTGQMHHEFQLEVRDFSHPTKDSSQYIGKRIDNSYFAVSKDDVLSVIKLRKRVRHVLTQIFHRPDKLKVSQSPFCPRVMTTSHGLFNAT